MSEQQKELSPAKEKVATQPKPVVKPEAKVSPTKEKVATPKLKSAATPAPKLDLPKEIFNIKVNTQAVFDAIMSERASRRQGTHSTKTRGEVRGGGRKPFAQKGTGNARQGSIRSPQWVGGGIVWGPRPNRNYTLKVNKKIKKLAYNSALTLKAKEGAIIVNDLSNIKDTPSTKKLISEIEKLKLKKDQKKVLIVNENQIVWKSASNLQKIFATRLSSLTVEAIVNADVIIFSKKSLSGLEGNK